MKEKKSVMLRRNGDVKEKEKKNEMVVGMRVCVCVRLVSLSLSLFFLLSFFRCVCFNEGLMVNKLSWVYDMRLFKLFMCVWGDVD